MTVSRFISRSKRRSGTSRTHQLPYRRRQPLRIRAYRTSRQRLHQYTKPTSQNHQSTQRTTLDSRIGQHRNMHPTRTPSNGSKKPSTSPPYQARQHTQRSFSTRTVQRLCTLGPFCLRIRNLSTPRFSRRFFIHTIPACPTMLNTDPKRSLRLIGQAMNWWGMAATLTSRSDWRKETKTSRP